MGAFAVALGAGLTAYLMPEVGPTPVRATGLAGLWALGAGGLALLAPEPDSQPRPPLWWGWSVAAWTMFDLLVAGWGLNPGVPVDFYATPLPEGARADGGRLYIPAADEDEIKYGHFLRFDTFFAVDDWLAMRRTALANINVLDAIPTTNNFDPLAPARYTRWIAALESVPLTARSAWLDLMAVSIVETAMDNGTRWTVRPMAPPRWRWIPCARAASGQDEALALVFSGQVDFESTVIVEGNEFALDRDCSSASGKISLVMEHPQMIRLQVRADSDGWVLLADSWYPGWRVWVDGASADLLPGDGVFRAVFVPAGTHQVMMAYRPTSFYLGALLSLIFLVGLLRSTLG